MSAEPTQLSNRIESRINKEVAAQTGLTTTGSMAFSSIEQIMEFSKIMAIAGVAIPKHLRDAPGACLAVAIQASEWQMSPFAVANKCYVVNDRLAYEAQLVAAVILKRAPLKGRIRYEYSGDNNTRRCKVSATLTDGSVVDYESPEFGKIPVKNSPLWKNDPDQQLGYFSVRSMCRRHFPDVLMGIYTPEEMVEETMRDVTPAPKASRPKLFAPKDEPQEQPPEPTPEPAPEEATPEAAPAPIGEPTPLNRLQEAMEADQKGWAGISEYLRKNDLFKRAYKDVGDLPDEVIEQVLRNFDRVEA